MDALRDEEHRETAGELPTRLIYDGERYGTEADAFSSGLAPWTDTARWSAPTARS